MKKGTLQRKSKSGRYTILKKIMVSILICCLLLQLPVFPAYAVSSTPLQTNGQLKVKGTKIVNSSGKTVILKGVSTHGINWFPQYVNKSAEYNGYCSGDNQSELKKIIDNGVKYATELGR